MFCGNCGAQLADDARFCGECGSPVNAAAPQGKPEGSKEISSVEETVALGVTPSSDDKTVALDITPIPLPETATPGPKPIPTPIPVVPIQRSVVLPSESDGKTMMLVDDTDDTVPVGNIGSSIGGQNGGMGQQIPPSPTVKPLPPLPPTKPKPSGGMGIIIAVLIVLIIAIIGVGLYIGWSNDLIPCPSFLEGVVGCKHVDDDEDGYCDKCEKDMPSGSEVSNCKHKDKDGDGYCDKCEKEMPPDEPVCNHKDKDGDGYCDKCDGEMPPVEPQQDARSLLEEKLSQLEAEADFNHDATYEAAADGSEPADASAGSPKGVRGIVWSDIRDCDGDNQDELAVLTIVPTVSDDNISVYKFQIYEVDSDGIVTCEDKKTYNLEKYQIYTIEHVIYQTDDAIYLIARQHRYKFKDGGKESYDMIALKYDGNGEMEKWDTDSDDVGPDVFEELFNDIGMSKTADGMSKKYEINYKDDLEELDFMRAKPSLYLSEPDVVSDMEYDFYRSKADMDAAYENDKRTESKMPL